MSTAAGVPPNWKCNGCGQIYPSDRKCRVHNDGQRSCSITCSVLKRLRTKSKIAREPFDLAWVESELKVAKRSAIAIEDRYGSAWRAYGACVPPLHEKLALIRALNDSLKHVAAAAQ